LAPYLEAFADVPVVLNHHNIESHLLGRRAASAHAPWSRTFFSLEARKVAALERALIRRAAQNLVVSDLDGDRLRAVSSDARITTVPNGVDVAFFQAHDSKIPEPGSLVFAGGMDWFPNRDAMEFFVADIWPALLHDNPTRRMTVVGRGAPRAVVSAARDSRFRVTGFVADVRPYIESASIYVCPIRVGGGTRLKILDALAMERPLVSTDLGVEGLRLVEGEHYLRANTPEQFVTQIRRLENDAALRQWLGQRGRAFVVKHHSWPRIGESLDEAYLAASRYCR
jgi:glycosyltransferase involved in cell wall biosynthesis